MTPGFVTKHSTHAEDRPYAVIADIVEQMLVDSRHRVTYPTPRNVSRSLLRVEWAKHLAGEPIDEHKDVLTAFRMLCPVALR